ncbi:serine hydrolase [Clostridium estertheticum]|uniref:Serine hydrolase n=1 Tax=Clostridium estertheticum TaxID=238834 RepID=A0A5N7ILY4_9CLOT|nr:serine hydrolase [Clostridium estertheticum]MPQ31329.1 serine hydrolase [Clostridium estertheticum]MPQ62003.1 serine hydrolase [Clostridium estertheticum]
MLKNILLNYLSDAKLKYSIYIKELNQGEICEINQFEIVPSASIIKLFIMGSTLERVSAGTLSLKDRITINKKEKVPFSILTLLDDDNSYTINDLILLMVIQSDNTATNKLIDIIGFDSINDFIKKHNFNSSTLQRKMMDNESRLKGIDNLCNISDCALFLELIYNGKLINEEYSKLMVSILTHQLDDSMMKINLPTNITIAHKTGDLDFLKHDVGIVYTSKTNYIFSMFTWEAISDNYAKNLIGNISQITYDYFMNGGEYFENHRY